ncbi:MAG: V-type ATP synthase subunit F [Clostridiales bacterium]|jgi:V/A-type H+-transporting ATPase subunit F|nr:V-type ATP synthase subunit F [Clostridiales bacterium]
MYKIAAVGDRDSITGFASVGFSTFSTDDAVEAKKIIRSLANSQYAVIFITEKLLQLIPEEYDRYKELPVPAIIPIPGVTENTGFGLYNVGKFVERAVGSDIIN